jgi:hypothetical protein
MDGIGALYLANLRNALLRPRWCRDIAHQAESSDKRLALPPTAAMLLLTVTSVQNRGK